MKSHYWEKAFKKGDVLGTYYGTLVYGNISSNDSTEDNMRRRYGVGIFITSVEPFSRSAVSFRISGASKDFSRTNLDSGKTTMEVFVVPASFSVFSHMHVILIGTDSKRKRQATVSNRPATFANISIQGKRKSVRNRYHLTEVDVFKVIAVSDIPPGVEVAACTEEW